MLRRMVVGAVLFSLASIMVGCTSPTPTPVPNPTPVPTPNPSGSIRATWIDTQLNGNDASIPLSEVVNNWITHFELPIKSGDNKTVINFMAYTSGEEIHVRANVCPPCQSIGYSLNGGILVCDRCATTFEAETGDGIEGACVDYPKAGVPYEISDGNIVMSGADLVAAFQNTVEPGWP